MRSAATAFGFGRRSSSRAGTLAEAASCEFAKVDGFRSGSDLTDAAKEDALADAEAPSRLTCDRWKLDALVPAVVPVAVAVAVSLEIRECGSSIVHVVRVEAPSAYACGDSALSENEAAR